jgi:Flp pilus assembly CpaF family ATPase
LELGISLRDLIYDTLRMRSDRTIMGEIRKPEEVKAFIDVLLSGQARGSYTTFHANSSDELVNRMIGYGVREDDIKFIDFVIIQKRILTYKDSTLKEIRKGIEIKHLPSNTLIYKYSSKPYFNEQAIVSILSEKLWMSEQEIKDLYKNRLEIISQTIDNFQEYQRRVYGLL